MFQKEVTAGLLALYSMIGPSVDRSAQTHAPEPSGVTSTTQPATQPISNADDAKARIVSFYKDLEQAGYKLGQGSFSTEPVMINGKPASVIVVGDIHTAEGETISKQLLTGLAQRYGVTTIFLEGSSADPTFDVKLRPEMAAIEKQLDEAIFSGEGAKDIGLTQTAPASAYKSVDYSTLPFEKKLGCEGMNESQLLTFALFTQYTACLEHVVSAVANGSQWYLSIDGKPANTASARLMLLEGELKQRVADFPTLTAALGSGSVTGDSGKQYPVMVFTRDSLEGLQKSQDILQRISAREYQDGRNQLSARVITEQMKNSKTDLALIIIGLAHTIETEDTYPSLPSRLQEHGISSVVVLRHGLELGVNKEAKTIVLGGYTPSHEPGSK